MIETVYILGAPATGKTTLVKYITQSWVHMMDVKTPLAYRVFKNLRKKKVGEAALIPILVKALQEADDKIDALTARVVALES